MGDVKTRSAVVTVSDTRQDSNDLSGAALIDLLSEMGTEIVEYLIVSDDLMQLRETIFALTERDDVDLLITTGGTGFGPRDNTPEATRSVIDREAPGIAEAMRRETAGKTPLAMLSRGIAGIRNKTLIINLPGSPKAVKECFEVLRPVLRHALAQISGDTGHEN
ncbi:MAG TPA: MogA/MoaB family molybdenum cofactor biosynthesis protein [Pyrinomonadaceae bacterium]